LHDTTLKHKVRKKG